jgi:hypothetical protein
MFHRSILSLGLTALLLGTSTASAQQIVTLPGARISDVTPDGKIVVGTLGASGGFYWNWKTDPSPTLIGGLTATAVSDDGSVIVGLITDPVGGSSTVAARWTQATGWTSLGYLPNANTCPGLSSAYDVSGDGSVAVGLSWDGCKSRAFRWTAATGMQEMQVLGSGISNRATTISGNGLVMGGYAKNTTVNEAVIWQPDLTGAFQHTAGTAGQIVGSDYNGSVVVGSLATTAFYDAGAGIQSIGPLNSGWASTATDVTEDGTFICGHDEQLLASDAWVWTAATGVVSLDSVAASVGITGAPSLSKAYNMSDDGNVIVGDYVGGQPVGSGGYVLEFNSSGFVNLGGGTSGALGQPVFDASGPLTAGSNLTLDLSNTQPNAPFFLWMSLSTNPANVVGGTLYPLPADLKLLLSTDPTGHFNTVAPVAPGAPSGLHIWMQCIAKDATNIHGITLSNCMRAQTP